MQPDWWADILASRRPSLFSNQWSENTVALKAQTKCKSHNRQNVSLLLLMANHKFTHLPLPLIGWYSFLSQSSPDLLISNLNQSEAEAQWRGSVPLPLASDIPPFVIVLRHLVWPFRATVILIESKTFELIIHDMMWEWFSSLFRSVWSWCERTTETLDRNEPQHLPRSRASYFPPVTRICWKQKNLKPGMGFCSGRVDKVSRQIV